MRQVFADPLEGAVEPIRIGVIEKVNVERIIRPAEGIGDELRPEGRAPDADEENVFELPAVS